MIALYDDGSYSFSLPAIPNVLIPLDTSGCKQVPPRPTDQVVTNVPTTKKSGKANCDCHAKDTKIWENIMCIIIYDKIIIVHVYGWIALVLCDRLGAPIHMQSQ